MEERLGVVERRGGGLEKRIRTFATSLSKGRGDF